MSFRVPLLIPLTIGLLLSIPSTSGLSQETIADSRVTRLSADLQQRLSRLLSSRQQALGPEARIGVAVVDADSGSVVFESNANAGFAAASNAKILTTAAALDLLGPSFQFQTELLAASISPAGAVTGNLYLRGRGNPAFDDRDMVQMIRSLKAQGVSRIDGSIVIDNSYFDSNNLPPHFDEQPKETAAFRAPIAATSFTFNAWTLMARPALSGTGPARIEVTPPNSYIKVVSTLSTVRSGRTAIRLKMTPTKTNLIVNLSGQIQYQVRRRRFRKRAPDPVLFVGTGLRRALADAGISVRKKQITTGKAPENSVVLATHYSAPLATMIRGMGKYSNNFVAELLLKVIGAETKALGAPATWAHAQEAVREFLSRVGIASGEYRYDNGSGLFDSNRLTPMQIVTLLKYAQREPRWGTDFFASLAIGGTDGTLRKRFVDTPAQQRIRAKTGTLAQASALSGIAAVDGNRPLLFSILVNGFSESEIGIARRLQDEIGIALIEALTSP